MLVRRNFGTLVLDGHCIPGLQAWVRATECVRIRKRLRDGVGSESDGPETTSMCAQMFREMRACMDDAKHLDWDDIVTYLSEVDGMGVVRMTTLVLVATGRRPPDDIMLAATLLADVFRMGMRLSSSEGSSSSGGGGGGCQWTSGHTAIRFHDLLVHTTALWKSSSDFEGALRRALAVLGPSVVCLPGEIYVEACAAAGEAWLRALCEKHTPAAEDAAAAAEANPCTPETRESSAPCVSGGGGAAPPTAAAAANPDQERAIRGVLRARQSGSEGLVCVVGPAGTGKTFTLARMADALLNSSAEVVVLAPTGAAARRAQCALARAGVLPRLAAPVSTIHFYMARSARGRGRGRRCNRTQQQRPRFRVFVVDEASMLDSHVCGRLAQALDRPSDGFLLVLVGDPNQLPPVGPGFPFADVIRAGRAPVFTLATQMRSGCDAVVALSEFIRSNPADGRYVPDPYDVFEDYRPSLSAALARAVSSLFADDVQWFKHTNIVAHRNATVRHINQLCVAHLRFGGAAAAAVASALCDPMVSSASARNPGSLDDWAFVGAKVVFTKNDSTLRVSNGTVGFVESLSARSNCAVVGVCDRGGAAAESDSVSVPRDYVHIQLAYAVTVHKSQGGECDTCLYVHTGTFETKELMYTAVTRARKRVRVLCCGNMQLQRAEPPRRTTLV